MTRAILSRPIRFGEEETKESLLDLACRMLGVFHPNPGGQCKGCPFQSRCWAWK